MSARKVWAYVLRGDELLAFSHPDHPDAGIQVPGGTLRDGEDPAGGVLRECAEETGVDGWRIVRPLGARRVDWGSSAGADAYGFELAPAAPLPDRWIGGEGDAPEPILFAFFWIPLAGAERALWPHQAAFLDDLRRSGEPKVG